VQVSSNVNAGTTWILRADCPAGKVVLGGGANSNSGTGFILRRLAVNSTLNAVFVEMSNVSTTTLQMHATAICASVAQ
jgi:hypothetical protein